MWMKLRLKRTRRDQAGIFRLAALALLTCACLAGCGSSQPAMTKYSYEFLGSFDTLIQFMGYAESKSAFEDMAKKGQDRFEALNRQYDRYHEYEGINNIMTINSQAGIAPVKVGKEITDLVDFSIKWHDNSPGVCNIALGPVLELWHVARTNGLDFPDKAALPDMTALKKASLLCDLKDVIVDNAAGTVFLAKAGMSLDVGAVAKGFACGIVADELKATGYSSFVISGGGNIIAVGSPKDGIRAKWGIGIQNPDGNALNPDDTPLDIAYVTDESVVTSGDYQRTYVVDGKSYHHLIDPSTLMPADYYRSVTVLTPDSGLADFFSTTLFLLPLEESRKAAAAAGVDALWFLPDGTQVATDGMKSVLKTLGGATNK
jgi:FAD:protein FMN transferase